LPIIFLIASILPGCSQNLSSAEELAAEGFCDRAVDCGLWVPNDMQTCVDYMHEVFDLEWPNRECEPTITRGRLDDCLDEIALETCRDLHWNIENLESCSQEAICAID
jgi:hypothetical protein